MSEQPFLEKEFEAYIESEGWTMVCESPLELQHEDGSFASTQAAKALLRELEQEFEEQENEKNSTVPPVSSMEQQDAYLLELNSINQRVQNYIKNASESTDYDAWDLAFERIFSPIISKRVFFLFKAIHVNFEYYDPDTSYQEDITAFANAFNEKVEKLNKLEGIENKH